MALRILYLTVACALLAGCSNNPHPPPFREKRADGTPWQASYRPFPDDPRSLDPQFSYDTLGHAVVSLVYEEMLEYHPLKTDPYELIPCLADGMPEPISGSDGTLAYRFRIKRGVYFHDDPCFSSGKGRELVAADMAYAFNRIADPKVECPVLSTLAEFVVGLQERNDEAKRTKSFDYSKPFPGIRVIDDHTFDILLLKPFPQLLYWMAMPFTAPVPREAVEYYDGRSHDGTIRQQFKFKPVGTGPFRLVEWKKGLSLRLIRNDNYTATRFPTEGWPAADAARYQAMAGKPIPFLDEVDFRIIRESIPAWLLFRQGYVEAAGLGKDVFDTAVSARQELTPEYQARGVWLYKDAEPSTFYFQFNMQNPVVGKNRKLRQAISAVYDVDLEIDIFMNGIYLNAQQLLPPGVYGYQADFKDPYRQHNVEQARQLLAEAGYPNGYDAKTGKQLQLTLDLTVDDAESRQLAEFEKEQIEKLGISVKVEENLWATQQDKMDRGNFQFTASGWNADYPDPENFFFLFYGKNIPPEGNNNSRYANPEFDRLFEKMRAMENSPERLDLIHRLNAILTEDCPMIPLYHPVAFHLSQPWAPRVVLNPLVSNGLKYTQIDVAMRKQKQVEWNRKPMWPLAGIAAFLAAAGMFAYRWSQRHG